MFLHTHLTSIHVSGMRILVLSMYVLDVLWTSCFDGKLDLPLLSYVSPNNIWRNALRTFPFLVISVFIFHLGASSTKGGIRADGSVVPFWAWTTWIREVTSGPARSLGEITCCQAWWSILNPQNPLDGRREMTPQVVLWLSCTHHGTHMCVHACIQTHAK